MSAPQPAHKARKENRMKNCNASEIQITRRILPIACATALAVACTASLAQSVQGGEVTITPPPVPANIQVPLGNTAFLVGHAVGTQNYICLPSGTGFKFTLFTPQATLFNNADKEVITHYFSPNPVEGGTIRATWQHSRDASTVWAKVQGPSPSNPLGDSSSDPNFVAPGDIAWLKLTVVGSEEGPTGGDTLTRTTFIQRLNTSGGLAPSAGCSSVTNVGIKRLCLTRPTTSFSRTAKGYSADRNYDVNKRALGEPDGGTTVRFSLVVARLHSSPASATKSRPAACASRDSSSLVVSLRTDPGAWPVRRAAASLSIAGSNGRSPGRVPTIL